LQGGKTLQIKLTATIYMPWGNAFHDKIISIIFKKYYATYNIARNMIQYEQGSLYYLVETKASSSDMEVQHQESYCKKSCLKFEASEKFISLR